jgi:anti-anti-sigma factor
MTHHDKFFTVRQEVDIAFIELNPGIGEILVPDELIHAFQAAVDEVGPAHFVIDFGRVDFCPSSVIAALIAAQRRVEQLGGRMKIAIESPHIRTVLQHLNLNTLLNVCDSRDDAVRACREELMQSR